MASERVGDFVSHHNREAGFVLANRNDAFVDCDFATGKTKSILLLAGDQVKLPVVIVAAGHVCDSLSHSADDLGHGLVA